MDLSTAKGDATAKVEELRDLAGCHAELLEQARGRCLEWGGDYAVCRRAADLLEIVIAQCEDETGGAAG